MLRWVHCSLYSRTSLVLLLKFTLLNTQLKILFATKSLSFDWLNLNYSQLAKSSRNCDPVLTSDFFYHSIEFFSSYARMNPELRSPGDPTAVLYGHLFASVSSLIFCHTNTRLISIPQMQSLSSQLSKITDHCYASSFSTMVWQSNLG